MKFSCHLIEFMSFSVPKTEEEWLAVAKQYQESWYFPYSLGPVDGKHGTTVSKIVPVNTYNYKNIFSIVLFTLVVANYNIVCECSMSGKSF
jgi:hypothetical protein